MADFPIITVDGPSGVGKGTLSQRLVEKLGFHFLDSGAIYRALAFGVLKQQLDRADTSAIASLAQTLPVRFEQGRVYYENEDISDLIRTEQVAAVASQVAAMPEVRAALLQRQRDFAQSPGLVADGRDMGTVVFPDAQVKLFLDASAQVRAQRRYNQLKEKGIDANISEIEREIRDRDDRDRNRSVAPLKPAEDAVCIDTSMLDIEQVVQQACKILREKGIAC